MFSAYCCHSLNIFLFRGLVFFGLSPSFCQICSVFLCGALFVGMYEALCEVLGLWCFFMVLCVLNMCLCLSYNNVVQFLEAALAWTDWGRRIQLWSGNASPINLSNNVCKLWRTHSGLENVFNI